jgi:hypothetical protein
MVYLGLIAIGLLLGVVVSHEGFWLHKTDDDKAWEKWRSDHEDAVHKVIMHFQNQVAAPSSGAGPSSVENEIRAQLAIEELIIKSREAEYAKFSALSTSVIAVFSAVLAAIVSIVLAKANH